MKLANTLNFSEKLMVAKKFYPFHPIKTVATIGPASKSVETLADMTRSGLSVARLNFSHGSYDFHSSLITNIRTAAEQTGMSVAIMLDTKGPEIRTGKLQDGKSVQLTEGKTLVLTTDGSFVGNAEKVAVSYGNLSKEVKTGDRIFVDDGLIRLKVLSVADKEISTRVENSAVLSETKGVNLPGVSLQLPVLSEKDKADLLFGARHKVDFVAASFVQRAADVEHIRSLLVDAGCPALIFSKVECQAAVDNFEEILAASDGIMVARGDLGIEVPFQLVPALQKRFVALCNQVHKPVIVATQMLQSMTSNPSPTRAEVSDVFNAVLDGADAVMLSAESASGKWPVFALQALINTAEQALGIDENFATVVKVFGYESFAELRTKFQEVCRVVKESRGNSVVLTDSKEIAAWTSLLKNAFPVLVAQGNKEGRKGAMKKLKQDVLKRKKGFFRYVV